MLVIVYLVEDNNVILVLMDFFKILKIIVRFVIKYTFLTIKIYKFKILIDLNITNSLVVHASIALQHLV